MISHKAALRWTGVPLADFVMVATREQRPMPGIFLAWVVAFSAIGWLLRCFWIGKQSLWYDEAGSVALAVQPLLSVFQSAALDIHPPLYFALLHFWIQAAGDSETALRLFSACVGVLAIPALAIVGRRLAGDAVGIVAAAAAAISPMFVYYGQETRMYAFLAFLSTLTAYATYRAVQGERRWWWVSSILMACALWTHLYGALLLAALNAWTVTSLLLDCRRPSSASAVAENPGPRPASLVPRRWFLAHPVRRKFLDWIGAQILTIVLFAPWIPVAWQKLHTYSSPDHGSTLGWIFEQSLIVFSLGHSVVRITAFPGMPEFAAQDAVAWRLVVPFAIALAIGSVWWARRGSFLPMFWLFIPVLGSGALSAGKRDVNIRYLIEATPAFFLIAAGGLVWLTQSRRWLPAGVVLGMGIAASSLMSLYWMYTNPVYARDDHRTAVSIIAEGAGVNAGVVLDADFVPVYHYYAGERWPMINLPAQALADPSATERSLQQFASGKSQVWLVLWHDYYADPHGIVWSLLWKRLYASDYVNVHGGLKVLRFDAMPKNGVASSGATFGRSISLDGYSSTVGPPLGNSTEPTVNLYWSTKARPVADYSIAAHLIDGAGNVYGDSDMQPADGHLPTSGWQPGDLVHTMQSLVLRPWTAAGSYRLQVEVYDQASGSRLSADGPGSEGTSVMLPVKLDSGTFAASSDSPLPRSAKQVDATFIGIAKLRGYDVVRMDSGLSLVLYWQVIGPTLTDHKVFVHGLDANGVVVATGDSNVVTGTTSMTDWKAGELVRDVHRLSTSSGGSVVQIETGLYDPVSGQRAQAQTSSGRPLPDGAVRFSLP